MDLKFKILNIKKDRCLNGNTTIVAECLDDEAIVSITIHNRESEDTQIIKNKLIEAYYKLSKTDKRSLNIGDTI